MRLSVTDRCNLSCTYCAGGPREFIPHPDILRYEECTSLISLARSLGVSKVRLTGGEPFVRKGFTDFVVRTLTDFPGLDLRITTNATLLTPNIDTLARAGLGRVNISLDTLDRAKYQRITGCDLYAEVRRAIDACLAAGIKVKVNCVAMRGVNQEELPGFVNLARQLPIDLRFIEFMPVGGANGWDQTTVWSAEEIIAEAGKLVGLIPVGRENQLGKTGEAEANRGPARMFEIEGGLGRLGVISPLSCHFCATCNRLRLTSDGRLRTCLFSDKTYNLRPLLRHPKLGPDAVRRVIEAAIRTKPEGYKLLRERMKNRIQGGSVCATRMHSIGG
ncbi:MAG: GTP 3',8-cyclase MoaA [Proteobacteria bacterium]|nr:GTP 3',8-cyclase MoaA [Pseudomonadota bacterium]MBU1610581.1 GTP 3',8-cyclase MoaA [Pseudomonadota bacterium]